MEQKSEIRNLLSLAGILLSGLLVAGTVAAAEVYRWVDENGEVHYSESLPPNYKDQGHDLLNERGIVVDENVSLTPEQKKKKAKKEKAEADKLKELPRDSSGLPRPKQLYTDAEIQKRMDSFLMLRYESEQEIVDAMNVEIKQLNYDRRLLQGSRDSMKEAYRGNVRVAADKQRAGKDIGEKLARKINNLKFKLAENSESLAGMEQREANIRAEFQIQLDRYNTLVEQWAEENPG